MSEPLERLADLTAEHHRARARITVLENAVRAAWLALRAEQSDEAQTILHVALETD